MILHNFMIFRHFNLSKDVAVYVSDPLVTRVWMQPHMCGGIHSLKKIKRELDYVCRQF